MGFNSGFKGLMKPSISADIRGSVSGNRAIAVNGKTAPYVRFFAVVGR